MGAVAGSTKRCSRCGELKAVELFCRDSAKKGGRRSQCRACAAKVRASRSKLDAARKRLSRYGLNETSYKRLRLSQGGLCAVCGVDLATSCEVDHDHATGEVRGLLCWRCNRGLGLFKDSVSYLRNAVKYLKNPPARPIVNPAEFIQDLGKRKEKNGTINCC